MNKRPLFAEGDGSGHWHKKHKNAHSKHSPSNRDAQQHGLKNKHSRDHGNDKARSNHTYDAVSQLPAQTSKSADISSYTPFTVSTDFPELPAIKPGSLSEAPFKHKSTVYYNRSVGMSSTADITYERLEFLGDAYIEVIASRLIFERYTHLPAGRQSQLRELMVKNETLSEYSRAYGFDKKIEAEHMTGMMMEDSKRKGNKGFSKVLGDVFEAYVAAVILSDAENGFATAEKWMTALWAPKLLDAAKKDATYNPVDLTHSKDADPLQVYNSVAKQELQKRIHGGSDTVLSYEPYRDTVELKGDQLGQNRHFIALYLTGWGYERKLLGKGEGKNKVEAGNWAATEAMHGDCKNLVEECEEKLKQKRADKAAKKRAEEDEKFQVREERRSNAAEHV